MQSTCGRVHLRDFILTLEGATPCSLYCVNFIIFIEVKTLLAVFL